MKRIAIRRAVLWALLVLLFPALARGIDVSIKLMPELTLPLDDSIVSLYSVGGGATAVADFDAYRGLSPLAEAALKVIPLKGTGEAMVVAAAGAGAGYFFHPIPRLRLRLAGSGGFFNAAALDGSRFGLYWSARLEGGYRVSPTLALLAAADYSTYLQDPSSAFFRGLSFGITVDLGLGSASSRSSGIQVVATQSEPVFPILYYMYEKEPLGTISVVNEESAEIRDLRVSFQCEGLTSAPIDCGTVPLLRRRERIELPLLASFGERVLDFTESAKAQGTVTVRYRLLDTWIERSYSTTVSFHHRNAMRWRDIRNAAAFASPNDASVLDLSKYVAGLVRDRLRPDLDHSFQYGMGLFEGLRLMGLSYTQDPSASYAECRSDGDRIDYIQYPYQTFAYKGGDSDDLSLLYVVALASVGLKTAFVPLPDKAYAAFALDSSEAEIRRFFSDPSLFAWKDDAVWAIVDVTKLREGFLSAWSAGADAWNAAIKAGEDGDFYTMADAWERYRPVGVGLVGASVGKPREDRLTQAFENSIGRFVTAELGPKVERMRRDMGPAGGSARQLNSLGILYAQYGQLEDAKKTFTLAAAKGSRTGTINLANVEFLLQDYAAAADHYQQVLDVDPDNKAAILGLARARYELDAYAEADDLFAQLNRMDPAFAGQYAYLSSRVSGDASRASSAAENERSVPWQDED